MATVGVKGLTVKIILMYSYTGFLSVTVTRDSVVFRAKRVLESRLESEGDRISELEQTVTEAKEAATACEQQLVEVRHCQCDIFVCLLKYAAVCGNQLRFKKSGAMLG